MNRTVPYLAGPPTNQLNFEAGENVLLKLDTDRPVHQLPGDRPRSQDQAAVVPSPSNEFLEVIEPPGTGPSGR